MPNTSPQAILVSDEKIRPAADRFGQLYNYLKALQAEATAESWLTLFPANTETIADKAVTDGRFVITNNDVRAFITLASAYITFMEQASNANRDLVLKIAVRPEMY